MELRWLNLEPNGVRRAKCRPILEELSQEEAGRLEVYQVDCDESPELAAQFGIMSMPTVIVFHNGEPADKLIGLRPKSVYQSTLGRYVS